MSHRGVRWALVLGLTTATAVWAAGRVRMPNGVFVFPDGILVPSGGVFGVGGQNASVPQGNTTDLRQLLINLGFLAAGGATPLDLNGGTLTGGVSTPNLAVTGPLTHTGGTVGFLSAPPVGQRSNTYDLRQALIDFGFIATGGATPLNLNGGALTATGGVTGGAGSFDSLFVAANTATFAGRYATTPATVTLTADNQTLTIGASSFIQLSSDSSGAGTRTFVLSTPTVAGQKLTIEFTHATNTADIVDDSANTGGGNVRLSAGLTFTQYDTLSLISTAAGGDWIEVGRSVN